MAEKEPIYYLPGGDEEAILIAESDEVPIISASCENMFNVIDEKSECRDKGITDINVVNERVIELDCVKNYIKIIPSFAQITKLFCCHNQIEELPPMEKLIELHCTHNKLKQIAISNNLKILYCGHNQITNIKMPCKHNNNMSILHCEHNLIENLDDLLYNYLDPKQFRQIHCLIGELKCNNNKITHLSTQGTSVDCSYNLLTKLSSSCKITICNHNILQYVTISEYCSGSAADKLHFNNYYLDCSYNCLTDVSIGDNMGAMNGYINCEHNQITRLRACGAKYVKCNDNNINNINNSIYNYNLHVPDAEYLDCSNNQIGHIITPNVKTLICTNNKIRKLGIYPRLEKLECSGNLLD